MPVRSKNVLPGFGLSLGYTVIYLSLIVLVPLSTIPLMVAHLSFSEIIEIASSPRVLAAFKLTLSVSFAAACLNLVFGTLLAWVLTRYTFPGKRFIDALIDLPFALPTAVAGISLATLYSPKGWIGSFLLPLGIKIAYSWWGIFVALTFVGLPFVVRTLQPVLDDLEVELEEASATLGASRLQTLFRVVLPCLLPAMVTGTSLAFARAIGEYGSVVFISGNMPMKTEILPLLIMTKLEQFDYHGAAALALLMLVISFIIMLISNALQFRLSKHMEKL